MQYNEQKHLTITEWAEQDRPREKLMLFGKSALSDAELLAILINTGSGKETAVDLAKKILNAASNNLLELSKLSVNDLMKHKGIGEAKAITIVAALELGRRRQKSEALDKPMIKGSENAYKYIQAHLADLGHEEFMVLFLKNNGKLICHEMLSKGSMVATTVDIRIVLKRALELQAISVILAHNHPSGVLKPSMEDKKLTAKIKEGLKLLDIHLLDHLIIGENNYYSFSDEGEL